ncbi:hypothetical protein QN388_25420, partial [Pseudomonas sp. 5B4]
DVYKRQAFVSLHRRKKSVRLRVLDPIDRVSEVIFGLLTVSYTHLRAHETREESDSPRQHGKKK